MSVNFPIPDYPDVETLTEMVSRVLIPYSSELGIDVSASSARQGERSASGEKVEGSSGENSSEGSLSH